MQSILSISTTVYLSRTTSYFPTSREYFHQIHLNFLYLEPIYLELLSISNKISVRLQLFSPYFELFTCMFCNSS